MGFVHVKSNATESQTKAIVARNIGALYAALRDLMLCFAISFGPAMVENYTQTWAQFDPHATQLLPWYQLEPLCRALKRPLGVVSCIVIYA